MSSGPAPIGETPLATPLPCWHESLHAARHDVIVALSERRARIATARPLPSGTPVFIEFRSTHPGGAGIDAVAVASDEQAFVVEFITIDAGAAAVLAQALRPAPTATVLAPPAVIDAPLSATVPVTTATIATSADRAPAFDVPGLADGPLLADPAADGPVDAPAEVEVALEADGPVDGPAPIIEVPPAERTGEFLTSSLILPPGAEPAVGDVDVAHGLVRTGEFLPIATPAPMGATTATTTTTVPGNDETSAAAASTGDEPATASTTATTVTTPTGPSWARALDADLGEEPDLGDVSHTQRWPTAHLATSSEEEAIAARAEATLPPLVDAPGEAPLLPTAAATTTTANTTTTTTTSGVDAAATPAPAAWTPPAHDDRDETTRWPVARAVVNPAPPVVAAPVVAAPVVAAPVVAAPVVAAPVVAAPVVAAPVAGPVVEAPAVIAGVDGGSAPPMAFEDGEEVVLEFTAPQRPAVREIPARPLPPPDDAGVVEVDFSEFRDVLGVATFRAETAPRASLGQRVATPEPISITLPRTPSTSLQQVSAQTPAKNPFGGDSGVGPRPDSSPPVSNPNVTTTPTTTAPADQWVVSSPPSLPAPRLLDGDFDRVLRSGGSNSVTPKPLPFHDSSPPTTPGLLGGAALPALTTDPSAPVTTTVPAPAPRVVPAARSPFAVPPVSPVIAPRPPAVVPVVAPLRPPVPVTLPPRPAMPSLPPLAPVALSTSMPPTPMVTPTVTPTVTTAMTPTAAALPVTMTPPSSTPAHLQSVTPSAEGLPLIVGEHGDDT